MLWKLYKLLIFFPSQIPEHIKNNWRILTKIGKNTKLILPILPPIPIPKLSKERAIAKNKASLGSIVLEWLKSEEIGLLKILKSLQDQVF